MQQYWLISAIGNVLIWPHWPPRQLGQLSAPKSLLFAREEAAKKHVLQIT